jgi:putative ABC transport system substrate-binding protein
MTRPPKVKFITGTLFDTRLSFVSANLLGTLITLVLALFFGAVAEAQQPKKVHRLGYLTGTSVSANSARIEAFRQGMRKLGYMEGENIVIEWRSAEGKGNRLPALAAELVRLKVDIIITGGADIKPCCKGSNFIDSHCHGVR